jgi:hypothetical protein
MRVKLAIPKNQNGQSGNQILADVLSSPKVPGIREPIRGRETPDLLPHSPGSHMSAPSSTNQRPFSLLLPRPVPYHPPLKKQDRETIRTALPVERSSL